MEGGSQMLHFLWGQHQRELMGWLCRRHFCSWKGRSYWGKEPGLQGFLEGGVAVKGKCLFLPCSSPTSSLSVHKQPSARWVLFVGDSDWPWPWERAFQESWHVSACRWLFLLVFVPSAGAYVSQYNDTDVSPDVRRGTQLNRSWTAAPSELWAAVLCNMSVTTIQLQLFAINLKYVLWEKSSDITQNRTLQGW